MATPETSNVNASAETTTDSANIWQNLLKVGGVKAPPPNVNREIESAVKSLAHLALRDTAVISDDVVGTIKGFIAEIDRKLNSQINEILHHEKFQKMEGAWRGLEYLVNNTETDIQLKIKVMNISKRELGKTLNRYAGANWDQSPLFKKIYSSEFGAWGGEPFACLVGDYHFDHTPPDVALLGQISQVAAAAHAPFIAGAGSSLMRMESWQEVGNPADLKKILTTPDYAGWRSLRESDDSRYLGLAMPRFLARLPYGPKTNPIEEFAFEEETAAGDHGKYTWSNSAYAMAANITRSFKLYGWCASIRGIESGGVVEGLPVHTFQSSDGSVDMKCPTEVSIDDRRDLELSDCGLMSLCHKKNSDKAAFIAAQSLHQPAKYKNADANANANLAARLPYLFSTCRFAHYLKSMVRQKIGSFKERADLERWLSDWIKDYVIDDPNAGETLRAEKPLAAASVEVRDIEGNPGAYAASFKLRPHYQLESVNIDLSLVAKLNKQG